jgi:hypothetical protein
MKKTWKFKLGIVLMIVCVIAFLTIPVVPFLNLENSAKITISTVLLVIGEITFWTGGLLLGKELFSKYKGYMNPKNWFKPKGLRDEEIGKINQIDDDEILNDGYRKLDDNTENPEIYQLSDNHKLAIEEAKGQIDRGEFISNDQANHEIHKGLKE